jgi:hypothetical protein
LRKLRILGINCRLLDFKRLCPSADKQLAIRIDIWGGLLAGGYLRFDIGIRSPIFHKDSYWYLLADANGLQGSERLAEGTTLAIPNKVANSANTSDTFKVYNESEIIGSTSPEIRTVAKKKKWYQKLIQILIIVIMIVAVIMTAGAALGAMGLIGPAAAGLLGVGAGIADGQRLRLLL